jgi:hypothetical protein
MSDLPKIFNNPGEALCWMVEVTMATLEHLKGVKSSSKSEIRRHESIVETGIRNCEIHKLKEAAHKARCFRVEKVLEEREKARGVQ